MTSDWPEFEACLREKVEHSNHQLEVTEELYKLVLLTDPNNFDRLMNILAMEKLILEEIFNLLTLLKKYQQSASGVLFPPKSAYRYEWN